MTAAPARSVASRLASWAAFAAALAYFLAAARLGLTRIEFGDETEKLVAALMQREGGLLYRDVFTHHGPLSYVLPHALVTILGPGLGLRATRVAVVLLTLGAAASIAWSPALSRTSSRALAGVTFLAALAPLWLLQALNLGIYHNLAGCLATVVSSQLVVPSIVGADVGRGRAFAAGLAAGLVPFAAYSHGPAVVLLAFAALVARAGGGPWSSTARLATAFAVGCLGAAALVVAWLARFGDLRRFLVYSFGFNERIYSRFIGFEWTLPFESLAPRLAPEFAARTLAVAFAALALLAIARAARPAAGLARRLTATGLLALGLLMLNPRGGFGFAANALVLAAFGTVALAAGILAEKAASRARARAAWVLALASAVGVVAVSEAVSRVAVSSPNSQPRAELANHRAILGPTHGPLAELVRSLVDPTERVQALIYRPHFYLETDRLPIAAQYYYLPWQAAYERDPTPGFETDLCAELRETEPPVVFFDDWLVWYRYRFAEYAPCIAKLLAEAYVPVALDPHLLVRRDRLVERWKPALELVPATLADRRSLEGHLRGLRPLTVELAATPGSCLARDAGDAPGSAVAIAPCDSPAACWDALDAGGGDVFVVGGDHPGCIEIAGSGADARVVVARCTGTTSQRFAIRHGAVGDELRATETGRCLAASATGAVVQGSCSGEGGWSAKLDGR